MENTIIGTQITKFRKAAGLTQEELGRAAGVSTQAVSRWECGGAPDVTLLPAIADKLGVTIDALFGREGGEVADINELVRNHFKGVPKEHYHDKLNRLVWNGVQGLTSLGYIPYLDQCTDERGTLIDSVLETDHGIYFGVTAEDMAFSTICPKPEAGYRAYFADNDTYRRFFGLLAMPGTLEILIYLLSQKGRYFTAELLAKDTGTDIAQVETVLKKMEECHMVSSFAVGTVDGTTQAYCERVFSPIIPFLYLARHLSEDTQVNYMGCHMNLKPLL